MRRSTHHQTPDSGDHFAHKRSLGQNFLTSDVVPKWLCDAIPLPAGEIVLEIGPGTGALTRELLARNATVIAIEADERAIAILKKEFPDHLRSGQLTLYHDDARELDLKTLKLTDHGYVVISNIPYYLSGFLLRQLLESDTQPKSLVFLMQKELVARIARDKKESLISLSVKAFGTPSYVQTVRRGHFNPIPKVDSAILAVEAISRHRLEGVPSAFFFSCLHLGLGSKRKQLIGNLSQKYNRSLLETYFEENKLSLSIRGEDLDLAAWVKLAQYLTTLEK